MNIFTVQNKVFIEFAFAALAKSACWFPLPFVSITKWGHNSLRADPFHITEHSPLLPVSDWRHIFRVNIGCVHQLSGGLLTGCHFSLFHCLSPHT